MDYKNRIYEGYQISHNMGESLKFERYIVWRINCMPVDDIEKLSKDENLDAIYKKALETETSIVSQIEMLINIWAEQAAITNVYQKAKKVQEANQILQEKLLKVPCNVWMKKGEITDEWQTIKNQTYSFTIRNYEMADNKNPNTTVWYVSYWFETNAPLGLYEGQRNIVIQCVSDKRFTNKEEMLKYCEGRKNYFSKYFKEERPPILSQYIGPFKCHGVLLDGYTVVETI